MSNKELLTDVLSNVIQNAAGLKAQIAQQEEQIAGGKAQLTKFDSLIATLQVSLQNDNVMAAIDTQAAANALISPTDASGAANDAAPQAATASVGEAAAGTESTTV